MTSVKNGLKANNARVVFLLLMVIASSCKKSVQGPDAGPELIVPVSGEGLKILDSAGYDAGFIWERQSAGDGTYSLVSLRNGHFRLKAFHLDIDGRQLTPLITMDGNWRPAGGQELLATLSDGAEPVSMRLSTDFNTLTLGNGHEYQRITMTTGMPERPIESILTGTAVPTDGTYKNDDSETEVIITLAGYRWVCKLELPTGFGNIYDIGAASPLSGVLRGNRLFDHSGKVSLGTVTDNLLRFRLAGREVELERR
ncbi:MAG: hypothetical protein ACKO3B_13255 [Bacteroidota bacterium]